MTTTTYSDLPPRSQAHADRRLLDRAKANNILGQFGEMRPLPRNSTKTLIVRRYEKIPPATIPVQEGVTPAGSATTASDYQVTLQQFGTWMGFTDHVIDTHEDNLLKEYIDILGENAPETWDILNAGVLKAGTNVLYANGVSRAAVNAVFTRDLLRTATRILKRQEAKPLRKVMRAGPNIGTQPISAAFVAVCHADLQPDWEKVGATDYKEGDWIPVHKYAQSGGMIEGEIGAVGEFRVVIDNNLTPWPDAGGLAATNSTLSTTGTQSDVYPILIFGQKSWCHVPLAGKGSVQTFVVNPKASDTDPMAQRGKVSYKGYHAALITQDLWMLRIETAAKG